MENSGPLRISVWAVTGTIAPCLPMDLSSVPGLRFTIRPLERSYHTRNPQVTILAHVSRLLIHTHVHTIQSVQRYAGALSISKAPSHCLPHSCQYHRVEKSKVLEAPWPGFKPATFWLWTQWGLFNSEPQLPHLQDVSSCKKPVCSCAWHTGRAQSSCKATSQPSL